MEKIYSNTWNAAKLIDQQQRGDNLFDTAVDITADQINRATTLFKQGEAKTRSLAGGFGYVAADASQFVKNSVAKKDPAMQAAAGAGMGIAKVFGTMPFGITDLLNKTIDKASEGPAVTTATLAVSVGNGIVKGGANIVEIATGWLNGSLSKQDLFGVASEIAETTAAALFFVVGAKTFKGGASRIGNALFIEPNVGPAAVVAVESSISIDASATLIGGIKMSEGALMMSSTGNVAGKKATDPPKGKRTGRKLKATDEEIAAALEKHGGDWNKAAKDFDMLGPTIRKKVRNSKRGNPLYKHRVANPKAGRKPKLSDKKLAEALERRTGNRKETAKDIGIGASGIGGRIKRAGPHSPLYKFKTIKGSGKRKVSATDEEIVAALERHKGDRTKAAKDVGASTSTVSRRVTESKSGSPYYKFKEIKGRGTGRKLKATDEEMAAALEKHGDDWNKAGKSLGIGGPTARVRARNAKPSSPLHEFKNMKVRNGRKLKVSNEEIEAALKRTNGVKKKAAKELGITPQTIWWRAKQARSNSSVK